MMLTGLCMKTYNGPVVDVEHMIKEFFSLEEYTWEDRSREKPRVSRKHDKDFFEFIWEHPEYEQFFDITP